MPLPSAWEKIVAKPWSSLMPLAGTSTDNPPASTTKRNGELVSPSSRRNHQNDKPSSPTTSVESPPFLLTHSKRLNRADMTIYGFCPAAERLALLPCGYCGDKFKCPALVDHIRLRHAEAKKPIPRCSSSSYSDKKKSPAHSGNRGRGGRFAKDKEKSEVDPAAPQVSQSDKSPEWTSKNELKRVETSQRSEREIPVTSVIPQFLLKTSAETVKESSRNSKAKLRKLKQSQPSETPPLYLIANSPPQLEKVAALPVQKSIVESSSGGRSSSKEKSKTETLSKKAKIDCNSDVETVLFTPKIETNDPADSKLLLLPSDPPMLTQEVISEVKTAEKTPETKRRKRQKGGNTRGGRVYDPDAHCGVIAKDGSRPCTRSLACRLHSIALRKAVKGRSRPFDVLLRREDVVIDRSKTSMDVVNQNNSSLDVDMVNSLINHPVGIKVSPELLSDFEVKPKIGEVKSVESNAKLSLPVSIKNLNLWSQLQQSPQHSDSLLSGLPVEAGNFSQPNSAVGLLNTFINNRRIKREPFSNESSASAMPAPSSSRDSMPQRGNSEPLHSSSQPLRSCNHLLPGYRRAGSLHTTSLSVPRMFRDRARTKLNERKAPPRTHLLGLKSGNVGLDVLTDFRKRLDLLKIPNKSVIAAMPNVAALVDSGSASGSHVVTKPLNLFGPMNGTTVLPLAIVQPSSSSSSTSSSPAVVGLLREEVVRLEPPGTHFFTPSGPIAFSFNGALSANQLALRNPRLMAPRGAPKPIAGSSSASGIVYLQRTLKTVH